jgi:hypothetical protein
MKFCGLFCRFFYRPTLDITSGGHELESGQVSQPHETVPLEEVGPFNMIDKIEDLELRVEELGTLMVKGISQLDHLFRLVEDLASNVPLPLEIS